MLLFLLVDLPQANINVLGSVGILIITLQSRQWWWGFLELEAPDDQRDDDLQL